MKQVREHFTDEVPLACTLSESELVTRTIEVSELFKGVQQVDELADGYALCFPGSDIWANNLVQFITFERGCCPCSKEHDTWLAKKPPRGMLRINVLSVV